jgi:hypothetical protein
MDKKEYLKQWREKNREWTREYARQYRQTYPEKAAEATRRWRAKNPDKVNAAQRKRLVGRPRPKRTDVQELKKAIGRCLNPGCEWKGTYPPFMLDFHHVDRDAKTGCVSQMTGRDAILAEVRKCTLICSNCHRLITWGGLDDANLPRCDV